MISSNDKNLVVAFIFGFTILFMILTMLFGMPLIDCIQNRLEKCGCVCCLCFKRSKRANTEIEKSGKVNIPHAEIPTKVMHFEDQNHETIDP